MSANSMRAVTILFAALAIAGCGGATSSDAPSSPNTPSNPTGPSKPVPVSIQIGVPSQTFVVGGTVQLSATVRDISGNVLTGETVNWTSTNTLVASVSSSGLVSELAPGASVLTASVQSQPAVIASTTITVTAPVTPFVGTLYVSVKRAGVPGSPILSYDIVAVDPTAGTETNLTPIFATSTHPIVSPNGQFVAFTSTRFVSQGELLVMRRDGTSVQRVFTNCQTNTGTDIFTRYCTLGGQWLADGRFVFLVSDVVGGQRASYIAVRDPVAQTVATLPTHPSFPVTAYLSPKGDMGISNGTGTSLNVVNAATGVSTQLFASCAFPLLCREYAVDNAFTKVYAPRDSSLVQVSIDGSGRTVLYKSTSSIQSPIVSPDGTYIAFIESGSLKLLRLDGVSKPTTLSTIVASIGMIAWSPDSKSIAFGSHPADLGVDGAFQVTVMNISGAGEHTVALMPTGNGELSGLDWGK